MIFFNYQYNSFKYEQKTELQNWHFLSALLCGLASPTFVGCKDYDDDIDRLDQEISNVKDAIKALEDKVGSGKYVESCTPFTDGNGGYEIKFSDGETIKLYNGAKGEQGEPGKPGTPGTPGTSADDYVVSVEEGESAYELVITYADGTKKTISMPKATSVVSGVKFILLSFLKVKLPESISLPSLLIVWQVKQRLQVQIGVQITLAHLKSFTQVRQT